MSEQHSPQGQNGTNLTKVQRIPAAGPVYRREGVQAKDVCHYKKVRRTLLGQQPSWKDKHSDDSGHSPAIRTKEYRKDSPEHSELRPSVLLPPYRPY